MNPTLIKIAQFLARRPKDGTIRMIHIFSGVIVLGLLWLSQQDAVFSIPFMATLSPEAQTELFYGLLLLGIIPLLKGLVPYCLVTHKTLRICQGVFGFLLIIVGGPIIGPRMMSV